jgi:hypothetical protein
MFTYFAVKRVSGSQVNPHSHFLRLPDEQCEPARDFRHSRETDRKPVFADPPDTRTASGPVDVRPRPTPLQSASG